jgi:rubrerythrin
MSREKRSAYNCQVCGGEAELVIEGFDTVKDVLKAGTMVCNKCGTKEDILPVENGNETVKAVKLAVDREREAYLFYQKAAGKTTSQKGKDMFSQLGDFELNHYKKMIHIAHCLRKAGGWPPYSGQKALKPGERVKELKQEINARDDDIDVLTKAIRKEEDAQALYRELAEKIEDSEGREMFKKLADEEEVHRRILNDQLYALSNRGLWVWGE